MNSTYRSSKNNHRSSRSEVKTGTLLLSWVTILFHNTDTLLKVLGATLIGLSFLYGFLVNQTVSITAQYSAVEQSLADAESRVSEASTALASIEATFDNHDQVYNSSLNQVEPSGFVSRDITRGFSINTLNES